MTVSRLLPITCLCATVSLIVSPGQAADDKGLEVGDKAPSFTVKDDQGKDWNSDDHFGKKIVVVYFYPADMTGGCTKQACAFRDDLGTLQSKNVEVVGVSGDSVRNHQLFKQAHDLNFTLLADTEGKVAEKFGVPYTVGEKAFKTKIDGKEETLIRNVTAKRWTFIVGLDGKIKMKNDKVNAAADSQAVLQALAENDQ